MINKRFAEFSIYKNTLSIDDLDYLNNLTDVILKIRCQNEKSFRTVRRTIFVEAMQLVKMIEDSKK